MKRNFWILFVFFLFACGPMREPRVAVPLPRTPEMETAFQGAEELFLSRKYPEAVSAYENYLARFPYNYFTAKTHYRLGEIYFSREQWKEAIPHYQESLRKKISSEWGGEALYEMAACYYRLGEHEAVFKAFGRMPPDIPASLKVRSGSLRVNAARKAKSAEEEVRGFLELVDGYSLLAPAESSVGELTWVFNQRESTEFVREWAGLSGSAGEVRSLRRLYQDFKGKLSGGYVLWKLVKTMHAMGNYEKVASWGELYLQEHPKHEFVPSAHALLAEIGKREAGVRQKVGVVLPLSGRLSVYGESVLHGLECAAGIFEPCRGDLDLILEIRDTEGDPQKAIPEVVSIIGPLSQSEAEVAAPIAERLEIPLVALSQKPKLPEVGRYIFRNFLTIADQVATVVHYACQELNQKEFAILYPQGEGGQEYLKEFERDVGDCGGTVIAKESYALEAADFLGPLRNLKLARQDYNVEKKNPFDVLFFPGTYRQIPDLMSGLSFLKMDQILVLGGAGWDHPELTTIKEPGLEKAVFVNGFYARSEEFRTKDFNASFKASYDLEPTLLEAYAYDSLRLLGSVLRGRPGITRPDLQEALTGVKNFEGVTGNISFNEEGDARRSLLMRKGMPGGDSFSFRQKAERFER
ncbi:MAG: ABC transporter substrate-binding protein [Deltaproteobacteria bacterium]|nr:ABC transporter substrate-binding protein [Deltaproteobacteria bacterium]